MNEAEYAEVQLYGRTKDGRSIVLTTTAFAPYFYVENLEKAERFLRGRAEVIKTEALELEDAGGAKRVLKVFAQIPPQVRVLRNELEEMGVTCYAADILFGLRFMYDQGVGPFVRLTGEFADEEEFHYRMSSIEPCKAFEPHLTVLSFDIEASPTDDHVHCICAKVRFPDGGEVERQLWSEEGDDAEIIRAFVDAVRETDPDIICGHYINGYDLPKLQERAELFGVKLRLGRDHSVIKPRYSREGNILSWTCRGRTVVDTLDVVRKEKYYGSQGRFTQSPHEDLDTVVFELGWEGEPKSIDASLVDDEWKANHEKVLKYCLTDAEKAMFILDAFDSVDKAVMLSELAERPLDGMFVPALSWLWDPLLIKEADRAGWLVPCSGGEKKEKIVGGYVADPTSGLHEYVCAFDVSSMYPSMVKAYNLCFSTFTSRTSGTIRAPNGARFLKPEEREGIVPRLLRNFGERRTLAKRKYKRTDDMYWERLERQVKVVMNSWYGLASSGFYRFSNNDIGEAITTFARETLKDLLEEFEREGVEVIMGDTDSLYVLAPVKRTQDAVAWGERLARKYSTDTMELGLERVFRRHFNHGRKKRYAGTVVWPEVYTYVRGYEMRRGDSFPYQREVLEHLLGRILAGEPDVGCKDARDAIRTLRDGRIETERLVIIKSCKAEREYKHPDRLPWVKAARKLKEYGYIWVPGHKIAYIVTDGSSPQQVEPITGGERDKDIKPDLEYYTRRMLDMLCKDREGPGIVETFGFDRESLIQEHRPSTLDEW